MPTIGVMTKFGTALYLAVILWTSVVIGLKPPAVQMSQAQQVTASAVKIEDIDSRLKIVESNQSKVMGQLAGVATRSEIDHQLLLGIAVAVIGMALTEIWRSLKGQRTRVGDSKE